MSAGTPGRPRARHPPAPGGSLPWRRWRDGRRRGRRACSAGEQTQGLGVTGERRRPPTAPRGGGSPTGAPGASPRSPPPRQDQVPVTARSASPGRGASLAHAPELGAGPDGAGVTPDTGDPPPRAEPPAAAAAAFRFLRKRPARGSRSRWHGPARPPLAAVFLPRRWGSRSLFLATAGTPAGGNALARPGSPGLASPCPRHRTPPSPPSPPCPRHRTPTLGHGGHPNPLANRRVGSGEGGAQGTGRGVMGPHHPHPPPSPCAPPPRQGPRGHPVGLSCGG